MILYLRFTILFNDLSRYLCRCRSVVCLLLTACLLRTSLSLCLRFCGSLCQSFSRYLCSCLFVSVSLSFFAALSAAAVLVALSADVALTSVCYALSSSVSQSVSPVCVSRLSLSFSDSVGHLCLFFSLVVFL
jgi:hypothetical protein